MSENNGDKIPTNEDIIADLTKDIESQCELRDHETNSKDNEKIVTPADFDRPVSDEENTETSRENSLDDYIDEELLKEQETNLSEEEKVKRRKEAIDLKNKGNEAFKNGLHLDSLRAYTEALRLCPLQFESDRSILYANRAASKNKLQRKPTAIDDCTKAIELNPKYVRAYLRRANLYEETEKFDDSLEDYKKILEIDPGIAEARAATLRLPPIIEERNEKLKTEMMGKLKDLGNMFLRPFGLSTENFQMQQDPNTGGYSVNFQQNAK